MSVLAHKWVSSGALKGQAAFAKARVVVSLHGIMGSGRNWMTAARQLVKRQPDHKVLLIDLRGHGSNATIAGPHTVAAAARDVAATVAHACGPDAPTPSEPTALLADGTAPLVLGHSFGGKVGLAYASTPAWQSTSEVPVTSRRWRDHSTGDNVASMAWGAQSIDFCTGRRATSRRYGPGSSTRIPRSARARAASARSWRSSRTRRGTRSMPRRRPPSRLSSSEACSPPRRSGSP